MIVICVNKFKYHVHQYFVMKIHISVDFAMYIFENLCLMTTENIFMNE